jgi:hypothetical protein
VRLGQLLACGLVHGVNRLLADHSRHRTVPAQQGDSLADEHLGIPATNRVEPAEAVIIDMDQHQADLVNVAGEHQPGSLPLAIGREESGE